MKTIAVINQKGGVGKTTTVANLGAAIAARGHRVCLIDLDPQSQLTLHFGAEAGLGPDSLTVYDVLTAGADLESTALPVEGIGQEPTRLWVVPSVMDLAAAETELATTVGREQILCDHLASAQKPLPYDYVLIDCPPSLGLLTLNALAAADELVIPLQAHFLALQGLGRLLETVALVQRRINPRLRVGGVILCMFEKNTRLAGEVVADLEGFFAAARGTGVPWADARIFRRAIRRNVKLAECPSYGQTIFDYEPASHGAEDYGALAEEFLAHFTAGPEPAAEAAEPAEEVSHDQAPPRDEPAEALAPAASLPPAVADEIAPAADVIAPAPEWSVPAADGSSSDGPDQSPESVDESATSAGAAPTAPRDSADTFAPAPTFAAGEDAAPAPPQEAPPA